MTRTPRSREAEAFFDALQQTPPSVVSACDGWTPHELVAYVAAAAAEIRRHLVPYVERKPVPATRSFEEREAPYQSPPDRDLRRRAEGATDVRLVVTAEHAGLELAVDDTDDPASNSTPPRALVICGRRPDHRGRFHSSLQPTALIRLRALLAGY
jgi:hypothetical protein